MEREEERGRGLRNRTLCAKRWEKTLPTKGNFGGPNQGGVISQIMVECRAEERATSYDTPGSKSLPLWPCNLKVGRPPPGAPGPSHIAQGPAIVFAKRSILRFSFFTLAVPVNI